MNDYFVIHRIVSLILLIIPLSCWVLGVATRCKERKYVAGVLRFFLGGTLLWIIDIICTIMNGCRVKILRCIDC